MNYDKFEDVEAIKKTYGLEIKRLKALCRFYISISFIFLITTIAFIVAWLDILRLAKMCIASI